MATCRQNTQPTRFGKQIDGFRCIRRPERVPSLQARWCHRQVIKVAIDAPFRQSFMSQVPLKSLSTTAAPADSGLMVGPFAGSNAVLQQFVQQTWQAAYGGKVNFPLWSTEYFDWQLSQTTGPDRRLCVQDNGQLAGVLMGAASRFRFESQSLEGAHYSWLSVAASHRGRGLAPQLDAARQTHEQTNHGQVIVSFRFTGSRHSLAERPRKDAAKFQRRIGLWARPLSGSGLRRWNNSRSEGLFAWAGTPFTRTLRFASTSDCLRPFDPLDLGQCLNIVTARNDQFAFTIDWDESLLQHQLDGSPVTQTLVWERSGTVTGFLNFHLLPFCGRTIEPVAVIDMIEIDQLSRREQSEFLRRALAVMKDQGAIVALKLRSGDVPLDALLLNGFTPRLRDSHLVVQTVAPAGRSSQAAAAASLRIPARKPIRILWR